MPALRMSLDLTGLPGAISGLHSALDTAMAEGLGMVADLVAAEARNGHTYTNRTGDLEASTQSAGVVGSFLGGSLATGVMATEHYGEYVDGSAAFAFLQPAFDRSESTGYGIVQDALDIACARAWP